MKVIKIDENGKYSFSIKQVDDAYNINKKVKPPENFEFNSGRQRDMSFEDMMSKFKQSSEEKMSELKRTVNFKKGNNRRGGR